MSKVKTPTKSDQLSRTVAANAVSGRLENLSAEALEAIRMAIRLYDAKENGFGMSESVYKEHSNTTTV